MELNSRLKKAAKIARLEWSEELNSPGWFKPLERKVYLNKRAIEDRGLDSNAVFLYELIHWSGAKLKRDSLINYSLYNYHDEESIAHKGALRLAEILGITFNEKSVSDMRSTLSIFSVRVCSRFVEEETKKAVDYLSKLI
jgi:hypothetical protein